MLRIDNLGDERREVTMRLIRVPTSTGIRASARRGHRAVTVVCLPVQTIAQDFMFTFFEPSRPGDGDGRQKRRSCWELRSCEAFRSL